MTEQHRPLAERASTAPDSPALNRRAFIRRSADFTIPAWIAIAFGCRPSRPSEPTPTAEEPATYTLDSFELPHEFSDVGFSLALTDSRATFPDLPPYDAVAELKRAFRAPDAPPMLVIVVPEDLERDRYDSADLWGGLFHYGQDETILRVSGCATLCAQRDTSAKTLGIKLGPEENDQGVLVALTISSDREAVREVRVSRELIEGDVYDLSDSRSDAAVKRLSDFESKVAAALNVVVPDLPSGDAKSSREALTGSAIPGSAWGESSGCGVSVNGAALFPGIRCGMGHVPHVAQELLWYLEAQ